MNASATALRGKHTATASKLYMAFELGEKSWKLALGDGVPHPATTALLPATPVGCSSA